MSLYPGDKDNFQKSGVKNKDSGVRIEGSVTGTERSGTGIEPFGTGLEHCGAASLVRGKELLSPLEDLCRGCRWPRGVV